MQKYKVGDYITLDNKLRKSSNGDDEPVEYVIIAKNGNKYTLVSDLDILEIELD